MVFVIPQGNNSGGEIGVNSPFFLFNKLLFNKHHVQASQVNITSHAVGHSKFKERCLKEKTINLFQLTL